MPIWEEALADLDPAVVVERFRDVERTFVPTAACPFPTPAHIRASVDRVKKLALDQEAEGIWQSFLEQLTKYYFPDNGWRGGILHPRVQEAANAAGGLHAIYIADSAQLVWRKKEFVACYLRNAQLEEFAPPPEASRVRDLMQAAEDKQAEIPRQVAEE